MSPWELLFLNQTLFDAIYRSRSKPTKSVSGNDFLNLVNAVLPKDANHEYKFICNKLVKFVYEISDDIKSVASQYVKYEYYSDERKTYNQLAKISLKEHLIRCFINCAYLYKDKKPDNFIALLCSMSLVHDIGKIPNLKLPISNQSHYSHEELSGVFLEYFFDEDLKAGIVHKETIVLMQSVIKKHHIRKEHQLTANPNSKEIVNDYALCLIEVDRDTRKIELKLVNGDNENVTKI